MMKDNDELRKEFTNSTVVNDLAEDFTSPPDVNNPNQLTKAPSDVCAFMDHEGGPEYIQGVFRVTLNVEKLPHYEGLPPLKQATPGSVGIDLYAAHNGVLLLNSIGATVIVPTGIKIELPHGLEAQIRPRSGLSANEGLTVLNSPGTIDSDYRGEIKVILTKLTTGKFRVERGMRIAQMVIAPVVFPTIEYVNCVDDTSRGSAGLGSSGIK